MPHFHVALFDNGLDRSIGLYMQKSVVGQNPGTSIAIGNKTRDFPSIRADLLAWEVFAYELTIVIGDMSDSIGFIHPDAIFFSNELLKSLVRVTMTNIVNETSFSKIIATEEKGGRPCPHQPVTLIMVDGANAIVDIAITRFDLDGNKGIAVVTTKPIGGS